MARLDRLGPAKEVAQIGGGHRTRIFPCPAGCVVCKPEVDLESALDRLIDAGLLFRLGLPPQCDLPGAEQHLSLHQ
jgi:hypothetical protein